MRTLSVILFGWALAAQTAAPPQTYSLTVNSSMFVADMTLKIYRDGPRELIDQAYAPRKDNPKGFHVRILYDFQAHKIYTQDLINTDAPCSTQTYTDEAAPQELDPIAGAAAVTAGLAQEKPKLLAPETINGIATKVVEMPVPGGQGKMKIWLDPKYNFVVKMLNVPTSGAPSTITEVKQISYTKPAATLFVPPTGCQDVGGSSGASGGHAEIKADITTPAATSAKPATPGKLQADAATTKAVALAWGINTSCKLERKNAKGEWSAIATTTDGKATDSSIGAYGTYTYRATCGAKSTNEVTVGPPPSGFHLIAPKPDKRPDTAFGRFNSLALDSNGDPAVAFVYSDPDGDGKATDTQVMFVAWDRAAYAWKEPVFVATVPNFDPRPPLATLSLAHDADTRTYGIVWVESDNKTLTLALSKDDGATWQTQKAAVDGRFVAGPTMVFASGMIHLAYADGANSIRYVTGRLDEDASKWRKSLAPLPAGSPASGRMSSLALDSSGMPALVYWPRPSTGETSTLVYWRPGSSQAKPVTGATTAGYPPDGVQLVFQGTQPRVVIDARLEKGNLPTHYSLMSNDDGTTWSVPASIPDDGNQRLGGFMSFALGANGEGAFASDVLGGNFQGMKCSWPKLARSTDLKFWTTCSPQGGLKPDTRSNFGGVIFSPSGMLYLVFQNRQVSQQELKPGLMIWGGR